MNAMQSTADLVGYQYAADFYCATDLIDRMIREGRVNSESHFATVEKVELMLDAIAQAENVNRYDESTFDSDDFPKVMLRDFCVAVKDEDAEQNIYAERCCECGCLLIEEDAIRWMDREGNWHE